MRAISELILLCAGNDSSACNELRPVIRAAVRPSILARLRAGRWDFSYLDDVLQELWLYLQANDWRCLKAFRGASARIFEGYVRMVACYFTLNLMRDWRRHHWNDAERLENQEPPDLHGPTEREIVFHREDVRAIMTATERMRLDAIQRSSEEAQTVDPAFAIQVAPRTQRRWREELYLKYGDRA